MTRFYGWVVLGAAVLLLTGCDWSDIGYSNDMVHQQEQMRENRSIPTASEMPPGLGEDLPIQQAPPPEPITANK